MSLKTKSFELRRRILDIVVGANAGHIGGDMSVIDILNVFYNSIMNVSPDNAADPSRDRFILSKGHAVEALYAVLEDKGFITKDELAKNQSFGSSLIGHPTCKVRGVEINSGSLGHGLSVGNGMALAGKMDKAGYRVYVVMGDGELAEGSVWEGAMLAGHYKLDNLTAVIDRNGLQISGTTEEVMSQDNLCARWRSFGWNVLEVDGNDVEALDKVFRQAIETKGMPTVVIAHTVKGSGVSFMENQAGWHHRVPTGEEHQAAIAELLAKEASLHE